MAFQSLLLDGIRRRSNYRRGIFVLDRSGRDLDITGAADVAIAIAIAADVDVM